MCHDDISATVMKNHQPNTMFNFNSNSQITNINNTNQKAFISSPIHLIPRNIWYGLFHKKLLTRFNLHRVIPINVEDQYYQLCKLSGKGHHMLYLYSKTRLVEYNFQEILVKP